MNSKAQASNATKKSGILKIAVPVPLFGTFDYLIPDSLQHHRFTPGCRVEVPFGRRTAIGVVLEQTEHSDIALNKLKPINRLIDAEAVLDSRILDLLRWAASYYLHPIGEVVQTALPSPLRHGKAAEAAVIKVWMISSGTSADQLESLNRAAKQKHILQILLNNPQGLGEAYLNENHPNWRPAMKALLEKGLAICAGQASLPESQPVSTQAPALNDEQVYAIEAISEDLNKHHIHLLHGVTGSGKTEVYLALSQQVITSGKQVLVLVPEISLTPQLTERFQQRMGCPIAVLHSGLNDQQRLSAWVAASTGHARLVIGTRSAIFTPLPDLGLIVVDEEHDGSYKQQEGFRYNARDLALVRSQKEDIPVVLGSATPSLESLHNVNRQRFHIHTLKQRARTQSITRIKLLDMCSQPIQEGLSAALLVKVEEHLKQGNQ
ncbi:MAG: primosomal protein N', partial [Gammaproteobacteria bacterium]|nr:primosomal protein N' [Gammaproteobacteria bacterium]